MAWFNQAKTVMGSAILQNSIPFNQVDVAKRYDIYHATAHEERLFANVRIAGMRTFERITEWSMGLGGLLEIEAPDGVTMLIPTHGIEMICEHGKMPTYTALKPWSAGK